MEDPTLIIIFNDFTIANTCSDIMWLYSAKDISSGSPITLPAFITFTDKQFEVFTSENTNVGHYIIEVTAMLPNL